MDRTSLPHLRGKHQHRPGFSLITILAFVFFMILVATGLVALSADSNRKSHQNSAEEEARANARLALMLAISELQRTLGPDQRVSAAAGILDADPDTLAIEGVQHPHWTGVWSTKWEGPNGDADNTTPWVRNDAEGGLSDRRAEEGYDRERELLTYLVSGNEGGKDGAENFLDARTDDLGADEAIRLVGPGSVPDPLEHVEALRVATVKDLKETGGYAFWVGDLGAKAHAGLVDRFEDFEPQRDGGPDGMERLLNAQDVEAGLEPVFSPPFKAGPRYVGQLHREASDREFGQRHQKVRKELKRAMQGLPKESFHDLTTWSRAVLANVRNGGLQRDLTAYLNSSGPIPDLRAQDEIVSPGLDDQDNLIGPANVAMASRQGTRWEQSEYREIAPKFKLLREWAEIAEETPWGESEKNMIPPKTLSSGSPEVRAMLNDLNVYYLGNQRPVSFLPLDTPNLCPVMVEGSIYYNLATYPDSPGSPSSEHNLRVCLYPRVALWNPFSVKLEIPPLVASIWVNGNKDVQLTMDNSSRVTVPIPFGRGSTKVGAALPAGEQDKSPAHYVGWLNFVLAEVTMEPGQTLVFSPVRVGEYSILNTFRNELSPTEAPNPRNYYYQDLAQKLPRVPTRFIEFPGPDNDSGSDNYMMMLKDATSVDGRVRDDNFDTLPAMVYANASLQAGGSDELSVQWSGNSPVEIHRLVNRTDRIGSGGIPDVRTRDGFRLRWWRETRSNIRGSGQLRTAPQHLETSVIGTWNPRAAYFCRTPFDNVTDLPPHFYGMYTRDLFDEEVSFQSLMPRAQEGLMLGNPFGPPLEGPEQIVLFEVPRAETGIPSLGYLRHLKLSEFGWAPSYAVGNSLADPRVGRTGTIPILPSAEERRFNGWNQYLFGWAEGRGNSTDLWARLHRQIVLEKPGEHHQLVHDLSFELNFSLFDDYFMSTGDSDRKRSFLENPGENPLPNGRMRLSAAGPDIEPDELDDFHRAASRLMLEGGFNVHSISKEAWKAVLASTRDTGYGREDATPFPRVLDSPKGMWQGESPDDPEATAGFRSLFDDEIDALAEELVREVKERAPFFGLADFINRRLEDSKHGEKGPIEAAISAAGINEFIDSEYPLDNDRELPNVSFDNMSDATRLDQTLKPDSVAWGIPAYLTQGDVVQVLGSSLRPRSDTFVVRAYGESKAPGGKVLARAWCEAIMQRSPKPIDPDPTGLNPKEGEEGALGRRFRLVNFRWLKDDEV